MTDSPETDLTEFTTDASPDKPSEDDSEDGSIQATLTESLNQPMHPAETGASSSSMSSVTESGEPGDGQSTSRTVGDDRENEDGESILSERSMTVSDSQTVGSVDPGVGNDSSLGREAETTSQGGSEPSRSSDGTDDAGREEAHSIVHAGMQTVQTVSVRDIIRAFQFLISEMTPGKEADQIDKIIAGFVYVVLLSSAGFLLGAFLLA